MPASVTIGSGAIVDRSMLMDDDPIVAVVLLRRSELELLGDGFRHAYPLNDARSFADLLDAIDAAEREAKARHNE